MFSQVVSQEHLEACLILVVLDGGLEEKANNLELIPLSKILSFSPLTNVWYFPHRVPKILIIIGKKN